MDGKAMDRKWTLVIAAMVISVLLIAGLAVAFWPRNGDGNGNDVPGPPGAPLGLQALVVDENVSLSWSTPVNAGSGIDGYNVYRSSTTTFDGFMIGSMNIPSYVDCYPVPARYYYMVKAYNTLGESPSSEITTVLVVWNSTVGSILKNGDHLLYEGMQTDIYRFWVVSLRFDFFNVTSEGFDVTLSGSEGGTSHYSWDSTIGASEDLGTYQGNATLDTVYGRKDVSIYENQFVDSASRTWTITYYVGRTIPVVYKVTEHCDIQDTYITLNLESTSMKWVRLSNTADS
jgi:hypothetical protein